ncbi:MAG: RsfS/YbeB/iojap family protein, partial [Flavobacteriales bacterium]
MQKQDKKIYQDIILQAILEKKGENITILDFEGMENAPAEVFVLCDAKSSTQLRAIASSIEEFVLQ